jgi:ketosteroid isomerase-like protein
MASHANHIRAILEALHRARENFDRAAAAALLTEDVQHHMPESFVPDPVIGRDVVAWGLTDGVARYYDPASLHREIVRTTVENDVAVVEQRMHGRTHDGTSFHNSYVWIYEFHGDLIYRMTEHADTLLAHRAFHGAHPGR